MASSSSSGSNSSGRSALRPSPALQAALDIVAEKLVDNGKVIAYEFDRLRRPPESEWNPEEVSAAAANPDLNRYMNVVPFDQNRVVLVGNHGDYINASLLTSKEAAVPQWSYIATQGPLAQTSGHFWQMVLQQHSAVVVMLTRPFEKQIEKCWQYFPVDLHQQMEYATGQQVISVQVVAIADLDSDICMRELRVTDSLIDSKQQVFHYHYHRSEAASSNIDNCPELLLSCLHTIFVPNAMVVAVSKIWFMGWSIIFSCPQNLRHSLKGDVHICTMDCIVAFAWLSCHASSVKFTSLCACEFERLPDIVSSCECRWPDFGIPSTPLPLRRLAHLLHDSDSPHVGPPVVHCSAGIGRTGTFVAIDATLKRLRQLDGKDIKGNAQLTFFCCLMPHYGLCKC